MNARPMDRHLEQEELERFLPRLRAEEAPAPGAALRAHLDGCARCRYELDGLRRLDEELAALPLHEPSPGFVEAVMARIRLPVPVPWYERVWAAITERSLLVVSLLAGVGASAGATTWWVTSHPGLSVGGLASFALERLTGLFWSAVVALGRRLWETGLPAALRSLVTSVDPVEAVTAMAVLSLCALAAGTVMMRLLGVSRQRLAASGR